MRQVGGREVTIEEGELSELDIEKMRAIAQANLDAREKHARHVREKIEERECGSDIRKWEALAAKRGYNRGWAFHRCASAGNRKTA